jgi:hypothetical protein
MKSAKSPAKTHSSASILKDVTRTIPPAVQRLLWGRAAARCEFWGCNTPLWKSSVTKESLNLAEKAHIYSFSGDGPRGNKGIAKKKLNDFENLLLVCPGCHKKIDKHKDGGRYSVALLQQWKKDHERRIEIVTGIDPRKKSHVLLYGANVGEHGSPLNFPEAASALFPTYHPADDRAIVLGTINSSLTDKSQTFWETESENLRVQHRQQVKERIKLGAIDHLSVFGIAPQPLLILLGTLLQDITNAEVFQRHREPLQTWQWPVKARRIEFTVEEPTRTDGPPAIVLALSSAVTDDRITAAVPGANIWRVTVLRPNMDLIKSRQHLSAFRTAVRELLDRIKAAHGQATTLHVFPAMGVSPAIELGRIRMPRASMPWQLYDQVNGRGFIPALLLPSGDPHGTHVS